MKAKKLIGLAVPVMLLLGGCGTDKADTKAKDKVEAKADVKVEQKESKKEDKLSVSKEENKKVSLEDYSTAILEPMTDAIKVQKEIQSKSKPDSFEELESQMEGYVSRLNADYEKVKIINPPDEFVEEQKQLAKSMETYQEAYKLQLESVKEKNQEKMNQSLNKISEAGKQFKEVTKKIGDKKKQLGVQ